KYPMVGSFPTCCARAASGHVAAAPPSSVMNWRRLIFTSGMGSLPEPAVPAYRRLRMPWKRPYVLGADLNRSESSRRPGCPRLLLPPPALPERRHRRFGRVTSCPCVGAHIAQVIEPSRGHYDADSSAASSDGVTILVPRHNGATCERLG